jgi:hypothetical protein
VERKPGSVSGDESVEIGMTDGAAPVSAPSSSRRADWTAYISHNAIEIWAAVLLSVATVATAWCAYQATRWGGEQQRHTAAASAARVEASRAYNRGLELVAIDADLFSDYAQAVATGDTVMQAFYVDHMFRQEFIPVLNAWLATDPLNNPDAPRNPFDDEAYLDGLMAEPNALLADAERRTEQAEEANQTTDEYILDTVFYATVLFFAGVSTKFSSHRVKVSLLALGTVIFLIVLMRLFITPIA